MGERVSRVGIKTHTYEHVTIQSPPRIVYNNTMCLVGGEEEKKTNLRARARRRKGKMAIETSPGVKLIALIYYICLLSTCVFLKK